MHRMNIEFDTAKDAVNRAKHGFPLALGALILASAEITQQDYRRDYGEVRLNAFGVVNGRLLVCTYTMRDQVYRIISVRKASRQEQRQCLS